MKTMREMLIKLGKFEIKWKVEFNYNVNRPNLVITVIVTPTTAHGKLGIEELIVIRD